MTTPQATPKHLTDEELKQQYGIHLASRLQEDGDGKEAKWADIDDDEDDWAPETIEWNDGTKINLAQVDNVAPPVEEQPPPVVAKEKEAEVAKSRILLAKPASTIGPNATVLKLGSAGQPKTGGLVLKGQSEKPTLVAKPSTSSSVKSPWASLPPVDKVPPLPINPPAQPLPSRFSQKDPHGFDAMPPPPSHAKEIAADDFSRSSREIQNGTPRELFNSQSGRYEPVNDTRKGSARKDQNFRPPSLLQRPSQNDPRGPAEPSPAFQTNRSGSQQEPGHWTRRRTSSNVSGDSGNIDRRMSLGKASELPRILDDNTQQQQHLDPTAELAATTFGVTHPKWAHRVVSPADPRSPSLASQSPMTATSQPVVTSKSLTASPQQVKAVPDAIVSSAPTIADRSHEAVADQKKLMREKREAAIKRKREEEEKEEAEKRERIRLKMEKLGLLDDKKGRKEAAEQAASLPPPLPVELPEVVASTPRSPPKLPLPDGSGVPQRYGMIRLHGPQPVNGLSAKLQPDKEPQRLSQEEATTPATEKVPITSPAMELTGPLPNGDLDITSSGAPNLQSQEGLLSDSLRESKLQPWKEMHQESNGYTPWNGTGMTTHSAPGGNLWGPPGNHRALGNGDFNHSVHRMPPRQPQYPQHVMGPTPQPIGPPKSLQQLQGAQPAIKQSNDRPYSATEDFQTIPTYPTPDRSPAASNAQVIVQQPAPISVTVDQQVRPATTSIDNSIGYQSSQSNDIRSSRLSAWADFGATTAKVEVEMNARAVQEQAAQMARLSEERRAGFMQDIQLPIINETWRQVVTNDTTGQRQVVAAHKSQSTPHHMLPGQHMLGDVNGDEVHRTTMASPSAPTTRSRFFGSGHTIPQYQNTINDPSDLNHSASPPPPESKDHPAYVGMDQRPRVNLPVPRPTVKLPPALSALKQVSTTPEVPAPSLAIVSLPLVTNSSWQDRFNGLFDRKTSPEKKFAHVVDFSSSKVPLELASVDNPTIITLPPQDEIESPDVVVSQCAPMVEDEEALFDEERDFGSVPRVRLPEYSHMNDWQHVKASTRSSRMRQRPLLETDVQSISPLAVFLDDNQRPNSSVITIRVGGMATPKYRTLPRVHGPISSTSSPRGKQGKGPKPREGSAPYSFTKSANGTPGKSPVYAGPSQQARPKVNSNNNNNMTWARRASGIVH